MRLIRSRLEIGFKEIWRPAVSGLMPSHAKPLFDRNYRDLVEKTRRTEKRQRRILRHRLLLWCFGTVLALCVCNTLSVVRGGLAEFGIGMIILVVILGVLGIADYDLKFGAGGEETNASAWKMFKWGCFFMSVQVAITLCLLLLQLHLGRIGDGANRPECRDRRSNTDHVYRRILRCY